MGKVILIIMGRELFKVKGRGGYIYKEVMGMIIARLRNTNQ